MIPKLFFKEIRTLLGRCNTDKVKTNDFLPYNTIQKGST